MKQLKRSNAGNANGLPITFVEEFDANGNPIKKWYEVDSFPNEFISLKEAETFANRLELELDDQETELEYNFDM